MGLVTANRPGVPRYTASPIKRPSNKVALVIPVINENGRLLRQLERLQEADFPIDVVIADGGSDDGSTSPDQLEALNVTSLLRIESSGGGVSAQLRMAFHHCLEEGYSSVITMDGNDKDDVNGIPEIQRALQLGYDYVQGSRYIEGGQAVNTPVMRDLAIRYVHAPVLSRGARFPYTDTTNGFRGFSRALLEDSEVAVFRNLFDSYSLLAYLPVRAARLGFKVVEVPVTRSYPVGENPPTKISGVFSLFNLLLIMLKAALGRYDPAPRTEARESDS